MTVVRREAQGGVARLVMIAGLFFGRRESTNKRGDEGILYVENCL